MEYFSRFSDQWWSVPASCFCCMLLAVLAVAAVVNNFLLPAPRKPRQRAGQGRRNDLTLTTQECRDYALALRKALKGTRGLSERHQRHLFELLARLERTAGDIEDAEDREGGPP